MANPTKKILAEALKDTMKTKPLDRISIEDITGKCGLKRQTFYYHFTDKYKLVNWIFDREVLDEIDEHLTYEHWATALERTFEIVEQHSPFYLNALHDNFSYFYIHLLESMRSIMISIIEELLGSNTMQPDDIEFFIDFYTNAYVGTFISWVNNGMREPGTKVVARLKKIISGSLQSSMKDYIV